MNRNPTRIVYVAGFVGVLIGVVAVRPVLDFVFAESGPTIAGQPPEPEPPEPPKPPKPTPEEIAKPHLSWADQECERIIDEHVNAIDTFFLDSQTHTRSFADEAMSWGSKWRLIADYVPFTSGGRHNAFIRGKFEEHIFRPEQLEDVVKQVVVSYLKHLESIEGQMLVRVRTDVADFPAGYKITQIDESKVREAYDEAIKKAIEVTGGVTITGVELDVVSMIAGEVLTQVAIKLGVSAGILGAGAGSSWATLGIGFVVGVIIDQTVSWFWDWYADPRGDLANEMNQKLDEMCRLIVDGSTGSTGSTGFTGLRDQLKKTAKQRSEHRKAAVMSLLQPQI